MMLYLRYQVEEYAFSEKKWGSPEALDDEFTKRQAETKRRKEAKFKSKLNELKKRTRVDAYKRSRQAGGGGGQFGDIIGTGKHEHEWGRSVENPETGVSVRAVMAYQSPSGMGSGGMAGGGESHGPAGTEYTLQGVMRFLQIEWHNHERARNAWDIERAEMKAKIAKQEGECRNSKKMQEQLDRQIKMLEKALRIERMKNKGVVTEDNGQPEAGAGKLQSKSRPDPKHGKPHNSFLDISDSQSQSSPQAEMDAQRDKSRIYLENAGNDLDIPSYFTHRGHESAVLSLAACPASPNFSTGGRASGDGWVFSGGQDCTIRVWERGRVDPKATIDGHNNCVWTVCLLPGTCGSVFGPESHKYGGPDRILLASGSSDGTIKIWSISPPPQLASPHTGSRRGVGGSRRHSVTSGSNFSSSPQPTVATSTPFHYDLVHSIPSNGTRVPTCISPLSLAGQTFVVSFNDSAVQIFDTRTGEEIIGMASSETYDGTDATQINAVVATSVGVEGAMRSMSLDSGRGLSEDEAVFHGATGSSGADGVEGQIITGHEDRYIRIFDANSGQCTYNMIAHPSSIAALSLSNDGREAVSAGHDASIRFWSLEKRICTQEISGHRIMRGEGVCSVVWSQDGRHVVSAGGDGVVKVFSR
ncbi:Striatin Pro11 [Cryomyces minteri]|uniref:Striatin Pro11 n=1 Tax=Cryomyces minteri TaxID=331657 RepID=A0A4U0WFS3_9PEZI|nr:Striatin Pro11 [Cryomyces minteri]